LGRGLRLRGGMNQIERGRPAEERAQEGRLCGEVVDVELCVIVFVVVCDFFFFVVYYRMDMMRKGGSVGNAEKECKPS
jgi:hypothetical protein